MAPLQKRALYSLVIGLFFTLALLVVLVLQDDITAFDSDSTYRWIMYAALIGVPLTYLVLVDLTLRKPTQLDERDKLIILRSGRVQWLAVIFSLVIWMIILTEAYRPQRQVPVAFLTLIVVSTMVLSILAQSAGILIGYWRMNKNA
jgi:hypothetical protein